MATSMSPRVSVVVPVYNAARWLGEAIESILTQTYRDLELIVVDDGSTDGSGDVARSFGERVQLVTQANAGPSAARNAGVARARGELIAFCDSDDVQLPYRIAAHVHLLDRAPRAALVAGDFSTLEDGHVTEARALRKIWIGPRKRSFDHELSEAFGTWSTCRVREVPVPEAELDRHVYQGPVAPLIALMHLAWGNAALVRRSAIREVGGFDEAMRYYEDWHLVGRIAKRHELIFLDVPVMHYRRHPDQMTQKPGAAEGYLRVINDVWRGDPQFYAANTALVERAAGSAYYQAGALLAAQQDWRGAERRYLDSIRAAPRQGRVYVELLKAAARWRWAARQTAREAAREAGRPPR